MKQVKVLETGEDVLEVLKKGEISISITTDNYEYDDETSIGLDITSLTPNEYTVEKNLLVDFIMTLLDNAGVNVSDNVTISLE